MKRRKGIVSFSGVRGGKGNEESRGGKGNEERKERGKRK